MQVQETAKYPGHSMHTLLKEQSIAKSLLDNAGAVQTHCRLEC